MIGGVIAWLRRTHLAEVVLALALGSALVKVANAVAFLVVDVLGQQNRPSGRPNSIFGDVHLVGEGTAYLSFHVGDTVIGYGYVLGALLTFSLVALAALIVLRDEGLRCCPHCLSRIPTGAAVCQFCSLEVEPTHE